MLTFGILLVTEVDVIVIGLRRWNDHGLYYSGYKVTSDEDTCHKNTLSFMVYK